MSNNLKYHTQVSQKGTLWQAEILRRVTSKKTKITKQKNDFTSEAEAQTWAETELLSLVNTLKDSHQRQNHNRKNNEEKARQRSLKRAEKTALSKTDSDKTEE